MQGKRYTYRGLNYPEEHEQILANVIIYKNNVIAETYESKLDGFALLKRVKEEKGMDKRIYIKHFVV